MNPHSIPTRYDWLVLEPLSAGNWLVSDSEEARLTGDGVIGHIQLFLGIFETLRRSAPLERHFFDSLASAVDSFAPSVDAAETARSADAADMPTATVNATDVASSDAAEVAATLRPPVAA